MHSHALSKREERFLEIFLILLAAAIACLFYLMTGYKLVVLNLSFLPVVLTGFFLGRYRAGVLAFLSVTLITVVAAVTLNQLPSHITPTVIALAILVWGASLGLTSLLVGTLSDERKTATRELHEAYVGVVEVLSQYLQSSNPIAKARSTRVAELSQQIAVQLQMSPRQIDDIRVAALLYEMGNVEITTKVICKAVNEFSEEGKGDPARTFRGKDLVYSLGQVLSGATPLVLELQGALSDGMECRTNHADRTVGSFGGRIIYLARAYDELTRCKANRMTPQEALDELSLRATANANDRLVLRALRNCIPAAALADAEEPQPALELV
jgi:hypothetical protein